MLGDFVDSGLLNYLRMQQFMQGNPTVASPQSTPPPITPDNSTVFQDDEQPNDNSQAPKTTGFGSFTPSTVARDRLNTVIGEQPQYQSPGFGNKLIAGIIGAGYGPQAATSYLDRPYERAVNSWQDMMKGAQSAASDENQFNNTGRSIAAAEGLQAHRDAQDDIARTRETDLNTARMQNAQSRSLMAQIALLKQQNPNMVFKEVNGQLVAADPKTGEGKPVINPDTGQPFAGMTDLDKMIVKKENDLALIAARGAEARTTKATPSGGETDTTSDLTPGQLVDAKTAKMNELLAQHPEWASYFKKDESTGKFAGVALPDAGFIRKGGDPAVLDEINKQMGTVSTTKTTKSVRTPATNPTGITTPNPNAPKTAGTPPPQQIPDGYIAVRDQQGKGHWMEPGAAAIAIKNGLMTPIQGMQPYKNKGGGE